MQITIIYIYIILILIKLATIYVDQKMIYLSLVCFMIILYLHMTRTVNVYLPMFDNIKKNEEYEMNKTNLLKFVDGTILFSRSVKLKFDLQNKLATFLDNLDELFYNDVKLCRHYIDIINNQRYEIMNLAKSYIITLPTLTDYSKVDEEMKLFQIYLYDLFFKVADKCPNYKDTKYKSANEYKNEGSHSFQQI